MSSANGKTSQWETIATAVLFRKYLINVGVTLPNMEVLCGLPRAPGEATSTVYLGAGYTMKMASDPRYNDLIKREADVSCGLPERILYPSIVGAGIYIQDGNGLAYLIQKTSPGETLHSLWGNFTDTATMAYTLTQVYEQLKLLHAYQPPSDHPWPRSLPITPLWEGRPWFASLDREMFGADIEALGKRGVISAQDAKVFMRVHDFLYAHGVRSYSRFWDEDINGKSTVDSAHGDAHLDQFMFEKNNGGEWKITAMLDLDSAHRGRNLRLLDWFQLLRTATRFNSHFQADSNTLPVLEKMMENPALDAIRFTLLYLIRDIRSLVLRTEEHPGWTPEQFYYDEVTMQTLARIHTVTKGKSPFYELGADVLRLQGKAVPPELRTRPLAKPRDPPRIISFKDRGLSSRLPIPGASAGGWRR